MVSLDDEVPCGICTKPVKISEAKVGWEGKPVHGDCLIDDIKKGKIGR